MDDGPVGKVGRGASSNRARWGLGPCGIPENTGIPGLDSNTDTGIFEEKKNWYFSGIAHKTRLTTMTTMKMEE